MGSDEEIDVFEDEKGEPLAGYDPEEYTDEELPTLPGYDYPVPINPLQPPRKVLPTVTIIEDITFPPDILPPVDLDLPAAQEPITRPPVTTTTSATTTTQPPPPTTTTTTQQPTTVTQPTRTVELRPEDLQSAVSAAIRLSVEAAVSRALEIQEATRISQESLISALRTAVEEAVRRTVISSVQSQTASRRPQSSRDLELAVQSAVRKA